jgi:hypothetical protein
MARIKKFADNLTQPLTIYQTFVLDSNPNSQYFRITEFKESFTGGKNGFLIEGSEHLKESTDIKIEILDVHVNKDIYQPKQYRYLGGITRFDKKKNQHYIQYFKAWNASFDYKGFNLDMNNDIAFECVPNALFKTYGTKKEVSNQYLHSVHKGGLDYVKNVLNRNNKMEDEKPINYVNPYDKMIKDAEKMIKEYINQYEHNIESYYRL